MSTTVSFPGLGWNFNINRVAFTVFGIQVYWYAIIIVAGLLLAFWYASRKSKYFGIDNDDLLDVLLIGGLAGVIGSRIYYVVFASPGEFTSFWQIFDLRRGGLAFYGAVIFAVLAAWLVCRHKKINFWAMADLGGIGFLIGQGVGRWGNFINQEAFGTNTDLPWGMISPATQSYLITHYDELAAKGINVDPFAPVHPTFLYESLWCLLGVLLFTLYIKRRKFDGEMFLMYLAWNGIGRFFIEGLRTDSLYLIETLRISQFVAALMVVVSISTIVYIRSRIKRSGDPEYLKPFGMTEAGQQFLKDKAARRSEQAVEAKERREARRSGTPLPEKGKTEETAAEPIKKKAQEKAEKAADLEKPPTKPAAKAASGKANSEKSTSAKSTAAKKAPPKSGAKTPAAKPAGEPKSPSAKKPAEPKTSSSKKSTETKKKTAQKPPEKE